jgi:hypothetical protein
VTQSRSNTMKGLPPIPTTFQVLCETFPKGVAALLSKSLDNFGKCTPKIISEAILFYEDNNEIFSDLTVSERREAVTNHLIEVFGVEPVDPQ